MRGNGRLFIILGIGLAALAALLAVLMFRGADSGKAVQTAAQPVKVIVAAQDIPAYTVIRDQMLTEQAVNRDQLKGTELTSRSAALGKASKVSLVKGQALATSDLADAGLSNDIVKGKRAVAVPVDRLNALAGMMRAGDYIDVIFSVKVSLLYVLPTRPLELDTTTAADREKATLPAQAPTDPPPYAYPGEPGSRFKVQGVAAKGDPLAKVVVQDVKVLRVDAAAANAPAPGQAAPTPTPKANPNAAPTDMVILELTDEQAELMKFILDNGASYTFTLRANGDHEVSNTTGITFDILVTNYQLPAPKSVRLPGDKQP